MDKQLTIVLTLKDRTPFTYRWMKYMNDIICPYPILIADGGEDRLIEAHLENIENYPNLNYTYIRYPYDIDLGAFYKKFVDVINRVETPYLLFADNDDFYLLDNIMSFINFLDENLDFVSCGGQNISLRLLTDKNEIVNNPNAKKYMATSANLDRTVTSDSGPERISYFMKNVERYNLWGSYYMIHRTSAVMKSVDFLKDYEFKEIVAFEIHVHMSLLLIGKYMQLNLPFYIRQEGTSQLTGEINKSNNLIERFIKNNTFGEIHKSIDALTPALKENEKVEIYHVVAHWFANQSIALYAVPKEYTIKTGMKDIIQIIYQKARRVLGPLRPVFKRIRRVFRHKKNILRLVKNDTNRLPIIEKYIIES